MSKAAVFCALCHAAYDEGEIAAKSAAGSAEYPWAVVKPGSTHKMSRRERKMYPGLSAVESLAAGYQPYCPNGHLLVEALFAALEEDYATIAVVGNPGSSKSCFIAAIFAEIARFGGMSGLGLTSSTFQSQDSMIDMSVEAIYKDKVLPDITKEDDESVGLVLRLQWPGGRRYNLVFYDVSGEVITSMQSTAEKAKFIFSSRAVILLLDPDGFPKVGDRFATEGDRRLLTPQLIVGLSDGFESVHGVRPSDSVLPIILTVPKADKVAWDDGSWPPPDDAEALNAAAMRLLSAVWAEDISKQLTRAGLGSLVATARARFGERNVRFSRASALGREVAKGSEGPINPVGTWHVIFEVLDSLGLIDSLIPAES